MSEARLLLHSKKSSSSVPTGPSLGRSRRELSKYIRVLAVLQATPAAEKNRAPKLGPRGAVPNRSPSRGKHAACVRLFVRCRQNGNLPILQPGRGLKRKLTCVPAHPRHPQLGQTKRRGGKGMKGKAETSRFHKTCTHTHTHTHLAASVSLRLFLACCRRQCPCSGRSPAGSRPRRRTLRLLRRRGCRRP